MGHGRGEFSNCAQFRRLEQLLPDALVRRKLLAQSGHESVVLHSHRDLVRDKLGQADEGRLEHPLGNWIEHVQEPDPPAGVVHKPDGQGGLDFRFEPGEMLARDLHSNRMTGGAEGGERGAIYPRRFAGHGPPQAHNGRCQRAVRRHDCGLSFVLGPNQEGGGPVGRDRGQYAQVVDLSLAGQHKALACLQNAGQLVGSGPLDRLGRSGALEGGIGASLRREYVTQPDK